MAGIGKEAAELLIRKAQSVGLSGSNVTPGMSPENAREAGTLIDRLAETKHAAKVEAEDLPIPVNSTAADVLADDVVVPVMDYTRGLLRASLGTLAGQGKKEDIWKTFTGHAPSLVEYVNRSGINKGPPLSNIYPSVKDSPLDITPVGTAAGIADMFLSPSNLSRGYKTLFGAEEGGARTAAAIRASKQAAQQAAQAAVLPSNMSRIQWAREAAKTFAKSLGGGNLTGDTVESLSKRLYNSHFTDIDLARAAQGKGPVSELLYQNGVRGTARQIPTQAQAVLETKLGPKIGAIEDEALSKMAGAKAATRAGGGNTPPGTHIPEENLLLGSKKELARDYLTAIEPTEKRAIAKVMGSVKGLKKGPFGEPRDSVALEDYLQWKRAQGKMGKFSSDARTSFEAPYRRSVAVEAAKDMENVFDDIEPGLGGRYHTANANYGTMENSIPEIEKAMEQVTNRPTLSLHRGDIPLGLGMAMYGEGNIPAVIGAAAAGRIMASPWGSTTLGYWGRKLGRAGVPDAAIRQYSLYQDEAKKNPYKLDIDQ